MIANAVLHEKDPNDPEELISSATTVDVEFTDEDAVTIWVVKKGEEGNASPGIVLSAIGAIRLGERLVEIGREAGRTVETLRA